MDLLNQTYFGDILYALVQGLLLPAVIILLALTLYAVWCVGAVVVEWTTERHHYQVVMPEFLDAIHRAAPQDLPYLIADSGLLGSQKEALLTLWDYRNLPVDSHIALAKRLIEETEDRHMRVLQRTQTVAKISPMLGLMGTLIPLGPGLVSLGQGNTLELSTSLLVAFDTTVAGLVVAIVAYVVTKIRQRWYDNYLSALEAATTALLEKVDKMRESGTLDTDEPTHFLRDILLRGDGQAKGQRTSAPSVADTVKRQHSRAASATGAAKAGD